MKKKTSEMLLKDWDIWHSYSSFLDFSDFNLFEAAESLVRAGVAECAMHSNGQTWWRASTGVRSETTTIELNYGRSGAQIKIGNESFEGLQLEGYPPRWPR